MKTCLVFLAIFLAGVSAERSFGLCYTPGEGGSALEKSDNLSPDNDKDTLSQSLPRQPHQGNVKKTQPYSSGRYSEKVGGHEIRSNAPITVLPPSSSGEITARGDETIVRPNSSGGIQAVGSDVSIIPNK